MRDDGLPYVERGKRAVIGGRTGSGKSTVAKWLLIRSPGSWLILNPKHSKGFNQLPGCVTVNHLDLNKIDKLWTKYRFVEVKPPAGMNHPEILDAFIEQVRRRYSQLGLYVDELVMLHKNGQAGDGLINWLTLGRENELSFIGASQRPRNVSLFLYSESDYFVVMSLNLPDDRKRFYEFTGSDEIRDERLPPRIWHWCDIEADTIRTYGAVKLPAAKEQN